MPSYWRCAPKPVTRRVATTTRNIVVPTTPVAKLPVPAAIPAPNDAKMKTMSSGSRRLVRNRINANVPTMPMPRARLLPIASINIAATMPPTTRACTYEREYDRPR